MASVVFMWLPLTRIANILYLRLYLFCDVALVVTVHSDPHKTVGNVPYNIMHNIFSGGTLSTLGRKRYLPSSSYTNL